MCREKFRANKQSKGFTLIELIAVVIIIAIVSVLGSGFIVQTVNNYHQTTSRSKLVQTGRQAIEQVTRRLRIAVPNSVHVSANSLCVEWLPIVAGANYLGELPDQSNGAPAISSIQTAPLSFDIGTNRYVAVSPLASNELYGGVPVSLALFGSSATGAVPNVVTLSSAKRFERNSVNKRLFIADHPEQLCISNGDLTHHSEYTTTGNYPASGALTGSPPNAGTLLAQGVVPSSEIPFVVTSGTEVRNTIVALQIPFEKGGEKIVLEHEVMIRNVP